MIVSLRSWISLLLAFMVFVLKYGCMHLAKVFSYNSIMKISRPSQDFASEIRTRRNSDRGCRSHRGGRGVRIGKRGREYKPHPVLAARGRRLLSETRTGANIRRG